MSTNRSNMIILHNFTTTSIPLLIAITWVLYISAMVAALLNIFLVYITIKHRSLHRSYSILLAVCSMSDVAHEIAFNYTLFSVVRGKIITDVLSCFYAQSYAVLGVTFSYTSLLAIAVDRLISILSPFWHRRVNTFAYVFLLLCVVCGAVSFYIFVSAYVFAHEHTNLYVVCMYSAIFLYEVGSLQFHICLVCSLLTVICYMVIGMLLHTKKGRKIDTKVTRRIFKSLVVILLIVICGWAFNSSIELLLSYSNVSPTNKFFITRIGALFINITSGADLIVLFFCSDDYRGIINQEMSKLMEAFGDFYRKKIHYNARLMSTNTGATT